MKKLRLIFVALLLMMVTVAVATEPSKTTVRYQGKRYYVHKVKDGDTLFSLARVYGVSQDAIIEVNGIKNNEVRVGSMVYVPYVEVETEKHEAKKPAEEPKEAVAEEDVHIVASGETLYSLSRRYGLTEQGLLELNDLKDHTDIKAGMTLRIKKKGGNARNNKNHSDSHNGNASSRRDNDGEMYMGRESDTCVVSTELMQQVTEDLDPTEIEVDGPAPAFAAMPRNTMLQVTLLLPFHARGESKENIVDFYRGVLLAMEDLKSAGYSIELTVLDTKRNAQHISDMIEYGELDTQLIIGPAYSEEFEPLLKYAEKRNIPVVSPLQYVDYASPVLFNMPAPQSLKSQPVAELLDGSREVVKIYASSNDNAFISEVNAVQTNISELQLNFRFDRGSFFYRRNSDGTSGSLVDIEELMRTQGDKVFVVMASAATDVDRILTTLASTKSSIRGRGLTYGDYMVVGNREWLKMTNIDSDIFFHNDVVFVVPYYANRIDEAVRLFDGRYITSYNALPSRTSYRGYDAAMIFCRMMYEGFEGFLGKTLTPLTTPYRFEYLDGSYTNTNWVRQHYRHDSKIVVE
jgi:LysM repeat protein